LRALRPGLRNGPDAGSIEQLMPYRLVVPSALAGWILLTAPLPAQAGPALPIDTALARSHSQQAAALTTRDGGRLWGRSLEGRLLFVDPATRTVLADAPDLEGLLQPLGGFYTGTLPPSENAANQGFSWGGRTWAMIRWPPASDSLERGVLLVHELWHRIQASLGLPLADPPNPHLGTLEGRLWLRLEARALATALDARGSARNRALRDALLFRHRRQARFRGADSTERQLEMNEGLAEYTGVVVAAGDSSALHGLVAERLAALDTIGHYERDFAYQTGPAYGFFLDQLAPGWRAGLRSSDDLSRLLRGALGGGSTATAQAVARGRGYGYAAVRREEAARERLRVTHVAALRERFVNGPVLELPLAEMKLGFDPAQVESMDSLGIVYGKLRLTDKWGVMQCDATGGLVSFDWHRLIVPAPADTAGRRLTGPGWVLELAPSWRLVPGSRKGDWTVTTP
jgi:hypothetical protein